MTEVRSVARSPAEAVRRPSDPDAPPTVLVAEDDAITRDILVAALARAGFWVVACETGEAALQVLAHQSIGALYADIQLGGAVEGWTVGIAFRRSNATGPLIYATGTDASPDRMARNSRFLRKPFRPDVLVEAVRIGPDRRSASGAR